MCFAKAKGQNLPWSAMEFKHRNGARILSRKFTTMTFAKIFSEVRVILLNIEKAVAKSYIAKLEEGEGGAHSKAFCLDLRPG